MVMTDKDKQRKAKALRELLNSEHEKTHKTGGGDATLIKTADQLRKQTEWISTGIDELDEVLGGGFPRGHATVIHGSKFTGKTSLALMTMRRVLEAGGYCMYVCTESYEPEKLEFFGLFDEQWADRFWVVEPQDYAEQLVDAVERVLWDKKTKQPRGLLDMFVVDSITNFVGKKETDKHDSEGAEGQNMMVRAQLLDNFLRRLQGRGFLKAGTAAVLIAQDRANTDQNSAKYFKTIMSGGYALGYNSKIILNLEYGVLKGRRLEGHTIKFSTEKNSIIGKIGKGEYSVVYGEGIDDTKALQVKAEKYGVLVGDNQTKGRGWYRFILPSGDVLVKGKSNLEGAILEVPDLKNELRAMFKDGKPKSVPTLEERLLSSEQPRLVLEALKKPIEEEELDESE